MLKFWLHFTAHKLEVFCVSSELQCTCTVVRFVFLFLSQYFKHFLNTKTGSSEEYFHDFDVDVQYCSSSSLGGNTVDFFSLEGKLLGQVKVAGSRSCAFNTVVAPIRWSPPTTCLWRNKTHSRNLATVQWVYPIRKISVFRKAAQS